VTENRGEVETIAWCGRQPADTMSPCGQLAPCYLFVRNRMASCGWQHFKRDMELIAVDGGMDLSEASVGRAMHSHQLQLIIFAASPYAVLWLRERDYGSVLHTIAGLESSENSPLSYGPDFGGCPGRWSRFVLVAFQQA
jgi:hypothetical protein